MRTCVLAGYATDRRRKTESWTLFTPFDQPSVWPSRAWLPTAADPTRPTETPGDALDREARRRAGALLPKEAMKRGLTEESLRELWKKRAEEIGLDRDLVRATFKTWPAIQGSASPTSRLGGRDRGAGAFRSMPPLTRLEPLVPRSRRSAPA